jgi:predicted dehydrogenase
MDERINRRAFFPAAAASALRGSPNSRIRLGFIGCGGRGRSLMRIFSHFADVEIAAVCDVIEPRMEEALKLLAQAGAPRSPERALDYRSILDRTDIDAVVIATTQHWHGLPFIHACQAGKHIYVEKPLSHTVAEGRAMVRAAAKAGVIALMGTQQRAGAHYRKAVEIVRSGRLGKIGLVECWNYSDRGPRAGRYPDSEPPPGYHWERWLGPAPLVPFNRARLDHNWWFDYGGSTLGNWGPHHFDIVFWAMGVDSPLSVVATGGKFVIDDIADTYDTLEATWEFPGFLLTYRVREFSNFHHLQSRPRHHGICFYGKAATLVLDRFGYEIYSNTASRPYRLYEFPLEPPVESMPGIPYAPGAEAKPGAQDGPFQRLFLDCLRDRRQPPVTLEFSHRVSVCAHLGNIAYQTRRRLQWDPATETFPGDEPACRLLSRPRRKGYELPEV